MKKIIAIISGDPNSINSEIIAKAWKRKNSFKNLNVFIIGSFVSLVNEPNLYLIAIMDFKC